MDWDFYAYGAGDIYRGVFSAVALMSGANAMDSLLRVAVLLGLIMGIVKAVTDFNVGAIMKWWLFAVVIYGVLWVPKVTVHITDRLNPTAVYAEVGNVPLGVGATASLVSQIGDRVIKQTETSFGDPADLDYSSHGMIFGAKMFSKMNQLRPVSQLVAQNMTAYMRNCAFYDIEDGTVPIDSLSNSQDMWTTLTANANPARLVPYMNTDGTSVLKKCTDDATDVGNDMAADNTNVQKTLYASLSSQTPDADLSTQENNVSAVVATAIGSSQDSMNIIRQAVVRNMMQDSLNGYGGDPNGVLGATMAELQTQNTQNLFGEIAEKAVVDLKIVIELLFIGLFPVLFPCFLLPGLGPQMAKGYLSGFLWLQLWGPMYVILHKIMMWDAVNQGMQATYLTGGGHAVTALTLDSLSKANQDVCSLAGSMMLMIPVLAFAVTKGAMAVGAQGEALLGNFRSGAETASAAETTGNWSFGNTAVGNHSYDDINAHQHITSPYSDENRSTVVMGNGITRTTYGDGSIVDSAALSSGAIGLNSSKSYGETLNRSASTMMEASQNVQTSWSVGRSEAIQAVMERFNGSQNGSNTMSSFSHDNQKSINDLYSQVNQTLEDHHITSDKGKAEAVGNLLSGSFGVNGDASLGLQEAGLGAKVGAGGSASKTGTHSGEERHGNSESSGWASSLQESFNKTVNSVASDRAAQQFDKTTSDFAGKRNVNSSSFSSQKSRNDTANWLQSVSQRASQEASKYMQGVNTLSSDATTAMFNYIGDKVGRDSKLYGDILHQSTPDGRAAFQKYGSEFLSSLANNEVSGYEQAMASPLGAGLSTNSHITAAEGRLGVGLDAGGNITMPTGVVDAYLAGSDPAHAQPAAASTHSGNGAHTPHVSGHHAATAPANDHHGGGADRLPAAIGTGTSTSSGVDAVLAGESAFHVKTAVDLAAGKQNTDLPVDTDPKITDDTKRTIRKAEHGQPFVMSALENAPNIGPVVEGVESWANSGPKKVGAGEHVNPDGKQTDTDIKR